MSREALVDRAIAVLEEARDECAKAPVEVGPGLRLALAFLYAISDDRALPGASLRHAFDAFLQAVTDPRVTDMSAKDAAGRSAIALANFNHICRRVGYGEERRARDEEARRRFSAELDKVEAARLREQQARGRGKQCPIQRPMRDRWR